MIPACYDGRRRQSGAKDGPRCQTDAAHAPSIQGHPQAAGSNQRSEVHGIAAQRAGHAVTAATAAAEFGADDRNDLDARLAQQRIGLGVAVVGEDHPGLERDGVVATVPLLALRGCLLYTSDAADEED